MILSVPPFHVQTATREQIKVPLAQYPFMLNHIYHPSCRVKTENSNLRQDQCERQAETERPKTPEKCKDSWKESSQKVLLSKRFMFQNASAVPSLKYPCIKELNLLTTVSDRGCLFEFCHVSSDFYFLTKRKPVFSLCPRSSCWHNTKLFCFCLLVSYYQGLQDRILLVIFFTHFMPFNNQKEKILQTQQLKAYLFTWSMHGQLVNSPKQGSHVNMAYMIMLPLCVYACMLVCVSKRKNTGFQLTKKSVLASVTWRCRC